MRTSTDRCYDFKNIFSENLSKKVIFCSNSCYFLQRLDHNIGFEINADFFAEKFDNNRRKWDIGP
jgi:hypothetical protein